MLIPFMDLQQKYRMKVSGILHLGAHLGEEAQDYAAFGCNRVVWVEANPELMPKLFRNVNRFGHIIVNALITDQDDQTVTFHVTNNFMSSSILDLGTHKRSSPDVHYTHDLQLRSMTVDTLMRLHDLEDCNFLNMDLQGAEMMALRGATEYLKHVDYIYSEVNTEEVYKKCGLLSEMDAFLSDFTRVDTHMTSAGWGDGFWIRKGKH